MEKSIERRKKLWYNIDRYYTCADSHSTEGRIISSANHGASAKSTMFGEYGIISTDIIPALIRIRPKEE